ncbi:MAG: hypothetical protein Q7S00_07225 [bacterium]|nr:hypothetical protein [bacterium]
MLIKRTSKNQFTFPKVFLKTAGISEADRYFDAKYDSRRHLICLKPVHVVIEDNVPEDVIERFEEKALRIEGGDRRFASRKAADKFLEGKARE